MLDEAAGSKKKQGEVAIARQPGGEKRPRPPPVLPPPQVPPIEVGFSTIPL